MSAKEIVQYLDQHYVGIWQRLEEEVTTGNYFNLFKQLSDNYSPTLTVSRVQGPLVESLLANTNVKVDRSLRKSGTIGLTIGQEPAPIWLSGHADICSYLTSPWDGSHYPLTPFCMPRARPGRRPAVALAPPQHGGPLTRLAEGEMVTTDDGKTFFATPERGLPAWTRVVYHLEATWDQESDEIHGYIDNQATCAALILAARVLSQYDVNALLLLNDEEEGPVDKGNQGFSRAMRRLLHRTPHDQLPEMVIVSDGHMPPSIAPDDDAAIFGHGALYGGLSSGARGAVVPPQLIQFARELAPELATHSIKFSENSNYISRSDDISAMQYTQNVMLIGVAGTSAHFDLTPTMNCTDLVNLTKTLIIYTLIAQDAEWRARYL
jgi:hypothetical protein